MKKVSELNLEEITECLRIYKETGEPQLEGDILGRISKLWNEYAPKEK